MKARTKGAWMGVGFLVYMLASVVLIECAKAGTLSRADDLNAAHIGYWYDTRTEYDAVMVVATALSASANSRALEDCRVDGEPDYACVDVRREIVLSYIGDTAEKVNGGQTYGDVADVFWNWCERMEFEHELSIALAAAIYVETLVSVNEEAS